MHRSGSFGGFGEPSARRREHPAPRFRKRPSRVPERTLDEPEQSVLHFQAPRGRHVRSVAFRYTEAVIDVIASSLDLDVLDLHADGRERSDERLENSTLRRKSKLNL